MSRLAFSAVQVIGGVSVLGSYAWELSAHPGQGALLWGSIPESWWEPYSLCMPFAAVGYLVASGVLWWHDRGLGPLAASFAVFLAASTSWMPLCFLLLDGHAPGLWPVIQGALALAGVACGVIAWQIQHLGLPSRARWAATIGWAFLCWQCVVLDAVVWPRFFG
jgi:hypothetical protein